MLSKRIISALNALLLMIFMSAPSLGLTLDDLNSPRPAANRMGIGQNPEKPFEEIKTNKNTVSTKTQMQNVGNESYADLSLKRLAQDVSYDLSIEQDELLADLQVLWAAAAQRSETIKYTIYKLSNPDENKPDEGIIKKIIKPIASFSTIAGTALSSNPYMASGALIGGGLLGALVKDDKEINYKFTKVTDADMVLLVRKIDDLQKKLLNLYIDYRTKKELMTMTLENLDKRREIYNKSQNLRREELIIADVYYRNAQNAAKRAESDFWASRMILENLVGEEVLAQIENKK